MEFFLRLFIIFFAFFVEMVRREKKEFVCKYHLSLFYWMTQIFIWQWTLWVLWISSKRMLLFSIPLNTADFNRVWNALLTYQLKPYLITKLNCLPTLNNEHITLTQYYSSLSILEKKTEFHIHLLSCLAC